MTKRVFRGIFCAALLAMLASLVMVMGVLYTYYDGRLKSEMEGKAIYVAQGIASQGISYFNGIGTVEDRITLIAADGTVLYDNKAEASSMENHSGRTEVQEALANGAGESERYSDTLSEKTCYYALRLTNGSVIRIARNQYTVWALLLYVLQPLCVIILLIVGLSAFAADRIAHRIVQPINAIDPENPDTDDRYEELSPLLRRLRAQNYNIELQMKELRRRQQEFSVLSDNMSEGLLILGRNGEVLSCNRSACNFFGTSGDLIGKNVLSLNRSEPFRHVTDELAAGHHSTHSLNIGERCYQVIGNPVTLENKIEQNASASTEAVGSLLLIVDITEREEREQLRREFSSNVSHELKTPLTSIFGVSEMLMSGIVKPEDVAGFARDIHNETDRLIRLVNDILRLSQLDEEDLEFRTEQVDLYDLSRSILERLRPTAEQRHISLELFGEHAVLHGVPDILDEMIGNLVDNAIKYNREGGNVKVTVSCVQKKSVVVVEDTGIGIASEHLPRLFERFYRVDRSHSRKIGGTGLGLSIVKHAAQYHNGETRIESTVGVGTKITLTLAGR